MNKSVLNEYQEQVLLVEYLEILKNQGKVILFSATPNNVWTKSWSQKIKQKKEGVRQGYPDMTIVTTKGLIFVELKRVKGGVVSPSQKEWIAALEAVNIPVAVCKGFDEAKAFVDRYV